MKTNRRGLLRGLLAALFGWVASRAAAAPAAQAPTRCPHYYDGVLWRERAPGQTGHYIRDTASCPFCLAGELAARSPATQEPPDPLSTVTTCVYDANWPLRIDPRHVTTVVYDPGLRGPAPPVEPK
jgi:hypothetical protein